MLRVKTYVDRSPIQGIGLFAAERIRSGTIIWEFTPMFDLTFQLEELQALWEPARKQIEKYSYFEAQKNVYVLCGDDARFMNHSDAPNTVELPGLRTAAARDIAEGEEITCNYNDLGVDS